jgi:hypothetical protein
VFNFWDRFIGYFGHRLESNKYFLVLVSNTSRFDQNSWRQILNREVGRGRCESFVLFSTEDEIMITVFYKTSKLPTYPESE